MCNDVKLTGEADNTVKEDAKTLLLELKQWINEKGCILDQIVLIKIIHIGKSVSQI